MIIVAFCYSLLFQNETLNAITGYDSS